MQSLVAHITMARLLCYLMQMVNRCYGRSEDGSETYSVKPHDLENFKLIIDRFGTDWSKVDNAEDR
jgi:hypothetical protein